MKILIKNATLIDGSGKEAEKKDLAVEKNKIAGLGKIEESGFDQVIDATGLVLAPGFIDTHSHSDLQVFKTPHLSSKLMQGITTEFLGQDGISMAPLPLEYISPWRKNIAGLNGDKEDLNWEYETTDNYLKMLAENSSGTNLGYFVPHGNVRMEARGLGSGFATKDEIDKMCQILDRELSVGCHGFSTGLIYMPCAYASTDELISLCKVSAQHNVPFVNHQRSEADDILCSMEEIVKVGRDSGVWIHFSHFKLCGKYNAPLFNRMLELLDEAQAEGIRVSFDQYPYVAGSTMLGVILPPWAHDGGTDELLKRLQSSEERKKMTHDIKNGIEGWDNFVAFAGLDGILITDVQTDDNKDAIGKTLQELGEMRGKDPLEATYDLLLVEKNAVGMVDFYGLDEHVETLIARPEMNVCTDALLGGKPHPRAFGSFPRVLGKYVREKKIISLPEAIHKMTARPASIFGLEDRGLLKEGYAADMVLFNPETIRDMGTYEEPQQYPQGIEYVFVNGQAAVEKGKPMTEVLAGEVLRRS